MIERMKTHISTVVGHYKGKVDAWDVVNEAIEDDGSWRKTKFYEIIGEDYLKLAFQFAREADPDAELLYNDYSMFHKGRRDAVVTMVKNFQEEGIPIDGIGMQMHYGLDNLPLNRIEESIIAFGSTGLQVHVTELDISVLPFPDWRVGAEVSANFAYQHKMNPYQDGLTDSASVALHDAYLNLFNLLLKHEDIIKRVTTWGIVDQQSWKNNWPMRGRTDYCLLFDRNYEPKPVVADIMKAAQEKK
jgi:endo-1,4-beta-xylanase